MKKKEEDAQGKEHWEKEINTETQEAQREVEEISEEDEIGAQEKKETEAETQEAQREVEEISEEDEIGAQGV